jgi:hypothetical protein
MEIIGEGDSVAYKQYDGWVMHMPEGSFKFTVGEGNIVYMHVCKAAVLYC